MIKLINLIRETKIVPKVKKEFHITKKNNWDIVGNLTIGKLTRPSKIYADIDPNIIVVIVHDIANDIIEFENNLKLNHIQYTNGIDYQQNYYYIFKEENNIKVTGGMLDGNTLDETKIAPKGGKREFHVKGENSLGDITGNLTIGDLTTMDDWGPTILMNWIYTPTGERLDKIDVIIRPGIGMDDNTFENNLKKHNIKYTRSVGVYDYPNYTIPVKENNIKIIGSIDETKVTPKTGKIPIHYKTDMLGDHYYFIPSSWEGNYEFKFDDILFDKNVFGFYFEEEEENKAYAFINKLLKSNIPYDSQSNVDGDIEVWVEAKYFSISKNIGETKITPKLNKIPFYFEHEYTKHVGFIPKEWQGNYAFAGLITDPGSANYGSIKFSFEKEKQETRLRLNNKNIKVPISQYQAFIDKLKRKGIPYKEIIENNNELNVYIDEKYFDIKTTDNIDETKVAPRGALKVVLDGKFSNDVMKATFHIDNQQYPAEVYHNLADPEIIVGINKDDLLEFEKILKKYSIKYNIQNYIWHVVGFIIPVKKNNIKVIGNFSETKIAPKKPFVLYHNTRTVNQWIDEWYYLFKDNIPNSEHNIIWSFNKDELAGPDLRLEFRESSLSYNDNYDYIIRKTKGLSDVKIERAQLYNYNKEFVVIFKIPLKYFEIKEQPLDGLYETKVAPKSNKIPFYIEPGFDIIGSIPKQWQGNYIFGGFITSKEIIFELEKHNDDYRQFIGKLKKERIPYREVDIDPEDDWEYDDDEFYYSDKVGVYIDKKYFDISKNIDETKIAPKIKKEFIVTATDEDGDSAGDLTIGDLTVNYDLPKQFVARFDQLDELQIMLSGDEMNNAFESHLKKYNIKYNFDEQSSSFIIPIKGNNIKIIDNIGETKIAPKKPFVLYPSTVDEVKDLYVDNDVTSPYHNYAIYLNDDIVDNKIKIEILVNDKKPEHNDIKWVNYLNKKARLLPGIVKDIRHVNFQAHKIWFIFEIPLKYFEIK